MRAELKGIQNLELDSFILKTVHISIPYLMLKNTSHSLFEI